MSNDISNTGTIKNQVSLSILLKNNICRASTAKFGITDFRVVQNDIRNTRPLKINIATSHIGFNNIATPCAFEPDITIAVILFLV
ncbi:hypothetical protein Xsto_04032 [Xenorhabdus stockiae]|uniref:Uncharacterized protein n=1 Tax=Xenorhabdus stockiae TaxID=351614 RepID=A0A2D0K824_9GAMM|nr:hypothetical protein Xsto_04032 [Xenorhabdus stockiae]